MEPSFLSYTGRLLLRDLGGIIPAPVAARVRDSAYSTCVYEHHASERLAHLEGSTATTQMRSDGRDDGAKRANTIKSARARVAASLVG